MIIKDLMWLSIFLLLIEKRIIKISYRNSISFEEPCLETLNKSSFKLGDIIIKFYNNISKCLYLLYLVFVISFGYLFLFNELKFLLINDIFINFLLGLILLLLFELKLDFFKLIFFFLSFISKLSDLLLLLFKLFNIS